MLWIPCAFVALFAAASMPLLQRHFKSDSFPMLFWTRIFTLLFLIPAAFYFYFMPPLSLFLAAALFGVLVTYTDNLFFRFVKDNNPAAAARIMKSSAIFTFFLWFAFDPALLQAYLAQPVRAGVICLVVIAASILAGHLRKCSVTMAALAALWPVLLTAIIYPILSKYMLHGVDPVTGSLGFMIALSASVAATTLLVQAIKKPVPASLFFLKSNIRTGAIIAVPSVIAGIATLIAFQSAPNPAYVSVILLLAPLLISFYGHLTGDPDTGDKRAGFGLVACAAILILVRI